jgi:lipoyl(octanoyl) transferase
MATKSKKICEFHWLGLLDYGEAWALQKSIAQEVAHGHRPATLLLLEHPPTFTFGRRGKAGNLLWDEKELSRRGIQTHWVDRGGDVTYHGPGQLVGYPVLPLNPGGLPAVKLPEGRLPQADYLCYLRRLEGTLLLALERLGIQACTISGQTGVWVNLPDSTPGSIPELAKVAALGVKVDAQGISQHGFALNVDLDMEPWQGIIPCGIADCRVTCLAELISPCPSMLQVRNGIAQAFAQVFDYEIRTV